jgi:hypothetical protein
MKTTISLVAATLLFAAIPSHAGIIAGPITNPGNGHDYYLLTPNSWSASEAEAENLGGTLAIVKNAAENEWVFSKFGAYEGVKRNLWIGLRRNFPGGPFAWITDEKPDYFNWHPGQPDNGGGIENCAHIWGLNPDRPDSWNDLFDNYSADDQISCGVVEAPGKSEEKVLTEKEKALIGTWYVNGDPGQPCWITGTENLIFAIDQNKDASRVIFMPEGFLFSPKWKQRAEIVKDKLLWSKGNWWSRKSSEFGNGKTSPAVDGAPLHIIPD